jgi:ubiquitin C-terminal hydrolase
MKYKRTWQCDDCGKTYIRKRPQAGMQLAVSRMVPDGEYGLRTELFESLDACLEHEFADVEFEGVECTSQACNKRKGNRMQKTEIHRGPETLVIQLARMAWDESGERRKLMHRIEYGERLDLSERSKGPLKYQLNGIVAHRGAIDLWALRCDGQMPERRRLRLLQRQPHR